MTTEETAKILMIFQSAYPSFKVQDKQVTINLWQRCLQDYDYNLVQASAMAFITTDKSDFAPSIGKLIDKIHELKSQDTISDLSAWALVSKAIRNGYYNAESEFEKLPKEVQITLGSPSQLRVWACDENFNESVVQSNFLRSYKIVCERQKNNEKLPFEIRKAIETGSLKRLEG